MPSQHGNGGKGGPWGGGGTPPDLEIPVRQGQDLLRQMLPGGNIDPAQAPGVRR